VRDFSLKVAPKNVPFLPEMYQKKLLADGQVSVKDVKDKGLLFQTTFSNNPHQRKRRATPKGKNHTKETSPKNYP
jgi:hypothetical protein